MDAEPPAHWTYYYYYYVLVLWKMSTHLFWNIKRHVIYVLWDSHLTNSNALIQCIFLRIWSSYGNKGDRNMFSPAASVFGWSQNHPWRVSVFTPVGGVSWLLWFPGDGAREREEKSPALAWFSVSQQGQFTTKPKFSAEMLLTSFNSGGEQLESANFHRSSWCYCGQCGKYQTGNSEI